MKKVLVAAFSMLMLCSLLLLITVGPVMAGNPDYSFIEYWAQVPATFDGEWTSDDEWTDGPVIQISENASFTYVMNYATALYSQLLIEIFTDNTNDAEDYWQICLDPSNDSGTAPKSGYGRIDIIGHTDIVCYEGDGTGWTEIPVDEDIEWAESISDSPWNSNPHWILELQFDKESNAMQLGEPPNGLRIAVYDASNPDAGVQAWPPGSDVNVPDEWGVIPTYSMDPIPESLTFVTMVFLSSVSLAVGSLYLQKRSKRKEK